jgi:hypothetical protein
LERDKRDVLDAARPLPPDEDVMIGDLTQDEDRLFIATILDTWPQFAWPGRHRHWSIRRAPDTQRQVTRIALPATP